MDARTRTQEHRYEQALGYVWGRKDATPYASPNATFVLLVGAQDFAAWYALQEGPLDKAFERFLDIPMQEQRALGRESYRAPWNPYERQMNG